MIYDFSKGFFPLVVRTTETQFGSVKGPIIAAITTALGVSLNFCTTLQSFRKTYAI
jgi:uncharacterized membrane protein